MLAIRNFDAIEVHPCCVVGFADGVEMCEPEDAHFWSVYGHHVTGGLDCFEDFPTEAEAEAFAARLRRTYPASCRPGAAMRRPAFVEIDGKLYRWRDLIARRREQLRAYAAAAQPALFELIDDSCPRAQRTAAGRRCCSTHEPF
jgi:hypothetical protein